MNGEVRTYSFDDERKILTYLDENEFKKKERALRKYFMGAYKYWIFEAVPKLQRLNKRDGKYELELPVSELFNKVYGIVRILFTVQNDVVILENIEPSEMLLAMHKKDLPTYHGIPYRDKRDKFKIDLMKEIKNEN